MDRKSLVCLMASYNKWMNANVYAAAKTFPDGDLLADRGAFFGSILKTLNHLVIADTIWLTRLPTWTNSRISKASLPTVSGSMRSLTIGHSQLVIQTSTSS